MKHLYSAADNYSTYVLMRDFEREDDDVMVVDHDVSEEEIEEYIKFFEQNGTVDSIYEEDLWFTWEEAQERFFAIKHIA